MNIAVIVNIVNVLLKEFFEQRLSEFKIIVSYHIHCKIRPFLCQFIVKNETCNEDHQSRKSYPPLVVVEKIICFLYDRLFLYDRFGISFDLPGSFAFVFVSRGFLAFNRLRACTFMFHKLQTFFCKLTFVFLLSFFFTSFALFGRSSSFSFKFCLLLLFTVIYRFFVFVILRIKQSPCIILIVFIRHYCHLSFQQVYRTNVNC